MVYLIFINITIKLLCKYNIMFIAIIISCIIDLLYIDNYDYLWKKELIKYLNNFDIYNKPFKQFSFDIEKNKNINNYTECMFIKDNKREFIKELIEYEIVNNNKQIFNKNLSDIIFFSHNKYKSILFCEILLWFNKKILDTDNFNNCKKLLVSIPNISFSCIIKLNESTNFILQQYKLYYKNLLILPLSIQGGNKIFINENGKNVDLDNNGHIVDLFNSNILIYKAKNNKPSYILICEFLKYINQPFNELMLTIHNRISNLTEIFSNI